MSERERPPVPLPERYRYMGTALDESYQAPRINSEDTGHDAGGHVSAGAIALQGEVSRPPFPRRRVERAATHASHAESLHPGVTGPEHIDVTDGPQFDTPTPDMDRHEPFDEEDYR